jgi:hypothetical protein
LSRPTRDRISWALSLIWVLLLCHGAFGALHLIPAPAFQPNPVGEHTAMHYPSGAHDSTPEELPAPHHTDSEYFAVLLGTFLGGLALWLLFFNHRRRDGTSSVRRFVVSPSATVFNLPRGPTLPFLQVLRL